MRTIKQQLSWILAALGLLRPVGVRAQLPVGHCIGGDARSESLVDSALTSAQFDAFRQRVGIRGVSHDNIRPLTLPIDSLACRWLASVTVSDRRPLVAYSAGHFYALSTPRTHGKFETYPVIVFDDKFRFVAMIVLN